MIGQQRESQFKGQGFLVLESFFTPAEISAAVADAEGLLARSDFLHSDNLRCRWQTHPESGEPILDTLDPVTDLSPAIEKLARSEKLLGTPFPAHVEHENGTLDEVRLRGTFNIRREPAEATAMLAEARRVLKAGGELMLHLLVADKAISKKMPRLPGPAALVEYTPTESEMVRLLEETGFAGISLKRLSHSAVFQFDGADMREMMLPATPKTCSRNADSYTVVYKGPFREVTDDSGVRYIRGNRTAINGDTFSTLTHSKLADNFVFLNLTPPTACADPHEPTRDRTQSQPTL